MKDKFGISTSSYLDKGNNEVRLVLEQDEDNCNQISATRHAVIDTFPTENSKTTLPTHLGACYTHGSDSIEDEDKTEIQRNNSLLLSESIVSYNEKIKKVMEEDEEKEEKAEQKLIEIQTKSGYKIVIYNNPVSATETIRIQNNDAENIPPIVEFEIKKQSICISSKMNLSIKADNIEMEAKESMKIKSGSTMTINGSLVKIN